MIALLETPDTPTFLSLSWGCVTASRERFGLRRTLVAGQVAVSLLLLVGALLFARSFQELVTTDAGFKPENVLAVGIDFGKASYPEAQRLGVGRNLTERLSEIPGVVSAARVGFTPRGGAGWDNGIGPESAQAAGSIRDPA